MKQKKKRWMLIMSCLAILFCSCGKEEIKSISTGGEDCEQSQFFMNSNAGIAETEEGFYIQSGYVEQYITFFSEDAGKEIYLCAKPECSHVKDTTRISDVLTTCNAYVGVCLPSSLIYHDNCLYILEYNKATYDVTVVRISKDGSNKERLAVIGQSPDQGSYYEYFIEDGWIYVNGDVPTADKEIRTTSLQRISLDGKVREDLYTYTAARASINKISYCSSRIYFSEVSVNEDETFDRSVKCYDLDTKKTETLIQNASIFTVAGNRNLIYYYIERDGLYQYDLESKKSSLLRKGKQETQYAHLAYDGQYIYIAHTFDADPELLVCDEKGEIVNSISLYHTIIQKAGKHYLLGLEDVQGYIRKDDIEHVKEWSYIK